jgi:hypothetical protein
MSHLCAVAACATALAGCLGSPRTGSELAHAEGDVRFEGMVARNDQPVEIQSYDYRRQVWSSLSRIEEFVQVTDPLGTHYRFSADVALPTAPEQWAPGRDAQSMKIRMRALQGGYALATFDAGADACLRRVQTSAQAQNPNDALERALRECQAPGSPAVELLVPHCGGAGESCCEHFGAAPSELCSAEFVCEQRRCVAPRYPVPLVAGHTQDFAVPVGARLREAWLEVDDRSTGNDTRISLVAKYAAAPGVVLERPQPDVLRLRFDLPLWQPGLNRHRVVALVDANGTVTEQKTGFWSLRYDPGPTLGHLERGRFALPARHFPMLMSECRGSGCKDADGDGLNDLWENVALYELRPRLVMDGDDRFFHTKDAVRVISSVVPLRRGDQLYVLFAHVVTFSRDYGLPVLRGFLGFDHAGDTEAAGLAFLVLPNGELQWAASVAKGHTCLTCKPSWHWLGQDWDGDGAPLLYVEENKHGLWQNGHACRASAAFDCEGNRPLRPEVINAGDFHEAGAAALVDELDRVSPEGPHAPLAQVFPGEALWTTSRSRVAGRFCGGRSKGCTLERSAASPGRVIGEVVRHFESGRW